MQGKGKGRARGGQEEAKRRARGGQGKGKGRQGGQGDGVTWLQQLGSGRRSQQCVTCDMCASGVCQVSRVMMGQRSAAGGRASPLLAP